MRIAGSRDEMQFRLSPSFKPSGDLDRFLLSVRPVEHLDARHHLVWRADAGSELPAGAGDEDVSTLAGACVRLEIGATAIEAELDAAATSIEEAVSVLERALALARRLSGHVGPYR